MSEKDTGDSLSVKIGGETVTVYTDQGPEYITKMADHINYLISEFNAKKGNSVRPTLLLVYAALELCNALFREQESKTAPAERNYEKKLQTEAANHKKTQSMLESVEKKLAEKELELATVKKDLEDFVRAFDLPAK